ncbi:MAG: HlyD family efflux transporter periplasmic adaptor subunit [Aquabacterium sp.]
MNAPLSPQAHLAEDDPLLTVLALSRKARSAGSEAELAFMAVNDSHALWPYRQAALWMADRGITALSGVIEPDANAPYAQWLQRVCQHLSRTQAGLLTLAADDLPEDLAREWAEWLPAFGLWLPLPLPPDDALTPSAPTHPSQGGLLLASERPLPAQAQAWLAEWMAAWHHAWVARQPRSRWPWRRADTSRAAKGTGGRLASTRWPIHAIAAIAVLGAMALPVKLSVLSPGELVPAHPAVVRAPLDGVLAQFHVQPNQAVKAGQPLFSFDQAALAARHDVAAQALATAQAEYRQYAQQAVSDARSKTQLAQLLGRIEERRAEAGYLQDQFQRTTVMAPQDGIALFDDPTEWIGKPVQTGERVLRIATPQDVEVEAWMPIGDAIPLQVDAPVALYLAADPLKPVQARLRYMGHEAVLRPDGQYAFRVRASLSEPTAQRVGLKGTAKLSGETVPLAYWILRRPLATVRQALGW